MPCYHPLEARRSPGGKIAFKAMTPFDKLIKLPCGRCIGCRIEQSRQKAVRAMHEASLHQHNCSLTLTYDNNWTTRENARDQKLSPQGSEQAGLSTKDHQRFVKRYRKTTRIKLRYMMCGEYGTKKKRPHYHYVIFGHDFHDKYYWKKSESGSPLYRSDLLEQIWPFGDALIGDCTFESCQYVAKYVTKTNLSNDEIEKRYTRLAPDGTEYQVLPEFGQMSRRPGIGYHWITANYRHVYARDSVIVNEREAKPPRFYDNIAAQLRNSIDFEAIKQARDEKRISGNDTPERLRAGETIQHAALKKRSLENT